MRNSACQLLGTPLAPNYRPDTAGPEPSFARVAAPPWPNSLLSDHSQTSVNHALHTSARSAAPSDFRGDTASFDSAAFRGPPPGPPHFGAFPGPPSSDHAEHPAMRMSQMRRDDSWSNLQRRLFGEPQTHAHASSNPRPPDAPGDPPGTAHTPAPRSFDVFSRFGGSFNKLLNSLTWLASLELSCREFHKGLGRNYSSGNLSSASSSGFDNPPREGSFYSLSPADSRRAAHSEYHSARSAHAPSAKAETPHPAFNPDYADHRLNLDCDFSVDGHNYAPHNLSPGPLNRHGRPAPQQPASHGPSGSGRAVEAQPAGGGRRTAKSYSGKFFYNDRVVDGVEQEVYDLDVDLGITYSRRRH